MQHVELTKEELEVIKMELELFNIKIDLAHDQERELYKRKLDCLKEEEIEVAQQKDKDPRQMENELQIFKEKEDALYREKKHLLVQYKLANQKELELINNKLTKVMWTGLSHNKELEPLYEKKLAKFKDKLELNRTKNLELFQESLEYYTKMRKLFKEQEQEFVKGNNLNLFKENLELIKANEFEFFKQSIKLERYKKQQRKARQKKCEFIQQKKQKYGKVNVQFKKDEIVFRATEVKIQKQGKDVVVDLQKEVTLEDINGIMENKQAKTKVIYEALHAPVFHQQRQKTIEIKERIRHQTQFQFSKSPKSTYLPIQCLCEIFQQSGIQTVIHERQNINTQLTLHCLNTDFQDVDSQIRDKKYPGHFQSLKKEKDGVEKVTAKLARDLGVSEEQIIIHSISAGSINIEYELINGQNKKLKLHPYFKKFSLSPQNFDPSGNFDFTNEGHIYTRGGWPYYQPHGAKRYGLKVMNQYDNGKNNWLAMNENVGEWAVAFHGVKSPNEPSNHYGSVIKSILSGRQKGQMLTVSKNNAFASDICQLTGQKIEKGIYFSPNVEVCLHGYTNQVGIPDSKGTIHQYSLVLQCRVRPDKIRVSSCHTYWVINESKYIRPYGILLFQKDKLPQIKLDSSSETFNLNKYKSSILAKMPALGW